MGEILLRAENIDKHFGITHALDNVSFTFNKGETVSYTHLTLPTIYSV